jgi:hypothetical protein
VCKLSALGLGGKCEVGVVDVVGEGGAVLRTSHEAKPGGAAKPPLRFKSVENNVGRGRRSVGAPKLGKVRVRTMVTTCNCQVRTCPACGSKMGWAVRQRLLERQAFWRRPGLLTLSIDRRCFAGAREAWERVTGERAVAELMRSLGVKRWMWVLEFQQKTGEGWPHWHVLVDLADLPRHRIDLKRAWEIWRKRWNLGGLDLTEKSAKLSNPEHAIFYLTKYLTKKPEGGFPQWVLESHSVRFLGGCRELGPLVSTPCAIEKRNPIKPNQSDKTYPPRRSHLERISSCGTTSKVWAEDVDPSSGEVSRSFLGTLPAEPARLGEMFVRQSVTGAAERRSELDLPVLPVNVVGEDGRAWVEFEMSGAPNARDVRLMRLRLEQDSPLLNERLERAEFRREMILHANQFHQRLQLERQAVRCTPGIARLQDGPER